MITREQLVDVDDRHKLVRLALVASLAISIAYLTLQVVLVLAPSERGHDLRQPAPAANGGAAGAALPVRP